MVPVFINGSEDHDFDEINQFNIYGKDLIWKKDANGPVGRLSLEGLDEILAKESDILGSSAHAQEIIQILTDALSAATDYNDFVFRYVNKIFGHTQ